MTAAFIREFGGTDKLIYGELPRPSPGPGELLVRVDHASVNPRDWIAREGRYVFQRALPPFPTVLGSDISGTVVARGRRTTSTHSVGDEVFGMQPLLGGMGAYAQYATISENAVAAKPAGISHAEAAAVPCAGLTAWQSIVTIGRVKAGDRVTITGASGGVGGYAVQFASARGAHVTAVCGPTNVALVQSLGADSVVDYSTQDFTDAVRNQHLVFDAAGRTKAASARRTLGPGGRFVSTIPTPAGAARALGDSVVRRIALGKARSSHTVLVRARGADLRHIANLMTSGHVRSIIDSEFALKDIADAHDQMASWHTRGKIVLRVP